MKLDQASRYASKIYEWLLPHVQTVTVMPTMMVAGSIRRNRPEVGDVDIVCIPKVTEECDMLGTVIHRRNHVHQFMRDYVATTHANGGKARIVSGETEGKQMIVELQKCQLDLWFADEANFWTRLICRTGSKEHNILIAQRALDMGCEWKPYEGLVMYGRLTRIASEQAFYSALKLPYIPPDQREGEIVARILRENPPR